MIEIRSLSEFIEKINSFNNLEYFYRGEDREFESRSPSIYQCPNLLKNTSIYYNRLLAELPSSDDKTPFETLSRLQHYGAKTRMLDITSNSLVALFFSAIKADEDGFVYVYSSESLKFETGHTAIMKAAINFIPNQIVSDFIMKEGDKSAESIFLQKLNEEVGNFVTYENIDIIRQDLKKAHIIIAKKQTNRISRQSGNFIMPAYEIDKSNVNYSIESLAAKDDEENPIVFKICKNSKKKILRDLSKMGIHEGSIYPDVENQTKYLIKFFDGFPVEIENSNENQLIMEITNQYNMNEIIFKHLNLFDSSTNNNENNKKIFNFLKGFHTKDSTIVTRDDDYFVGLRANHFVVEVGYSEQPYDGDGEEQRYAIITANHKGSRLTTGVRLNK